MHAMLICGHWLMLGDRKYKYLALTWKFTAVICANTGFNVSPVWSKFTLSLEKTVTVCFLRGKSWVIPRWHFLFSSPQLSVFLLIFVLARRCNVKPVSPELADAWCIFLHRFTDVTRWDNSRFFEKLNDVHFAAVHLSSCKTSVSRLEIYLTFYKDVLVNIEANSNKQRIKFSLGLFNIFENVLRWHHSLDKYYKWQ